jgi:hypothetical protein
MVTTAGDLLEMNQVIHADPCPNSNAYRLPLPHQKKIKLFLNSE